MNIYNSGIQRNNKLLWPSVKNGLLIFITVYLIGQIIFLKLGYSLYATQYYVYLLVISKYYIIPLIGLIGGVYFGYRTYTLGFDGNNILGTNEKNPENQALLENVYKTLKMVSLIGIPLLSVLLLLSFPLCEASSIGANPLGIGRYSNVGCSMEVGLLTLTLVGMMFAGAPAVIFFILIGVISKTESVSSKIFRGIPFWFLFFYLLFAFFFLFMAPLMVLFFIVLIVVAISIVFVIRTKDPDNTKSNLNIEVPLERQFVSSIVNMEIRNIEAVRFIENGGKSYTINLASIKKIARYLEEKYGKRVYSPGELNSEKAFLLKNFGSRLGPEKFKLLVDTLSQWVENGGSFEYIRKSI